MADVRTILTRLSDVIVATGAGFRPSTYRRALEKDPAQGVHRQFQITSVGGRNTQQVYGDQKTTIDLDVLVRVAYWRGGGDLGGGDIRSVNTTAGEDAVLIPDALMDIRNWDPVNTDIIRVTAGAIAVLASAGKLVEVYEHRFVCRAWFDWPT